MFKFFKSSVSFFFVLSATENSAFYTSGRKTALLITHQRKKRIYNKRYAVKKQCRNLKARRFSGTGRQKHNLSSVTENVIAQFRRTVIFLRAVLSAGRLIRVNDICNYKTLPRIQILNAEPFARRKNSRIITEKVVRINSTGKIIFFFHTPINRIFCKKNGSKQKKICKEKANI